MFQRLAKGCNRMGIFGPDIDQTFVRTNGDTGNGHAFNQHERITFHDQPISKSSAITFIGVADYIFLIRPGPQHGAPFNAGGKPRPAAATQAGLCDGVDNGRRSHPYRLAKAKIAAMGLIIAKRQRIDDPAPGKGQPGLPLQIIDFFHQPKAQWMITRIRKSAIKQACHIFHLHGPEPITLAIAFDFDQGFEKKQAA